MLHISSEVVIEASPGGTIDSFVNEVFYHFFKSKNLSSTCIIAFNGWFYRLDRRISIDAEEVLQSYYTFCNAQGSHRGNKR